jgi:hypothetical protein
MARAKGIRCDAVWDGRVVAIRRGGALLRQQVVTSLLDALDVLADWRAEVEDGGWVTRCFALSEEKDGGRWHIWLYRRKK